MTAANLKAVVDKQFEECRNLLKTKGADYVPDRSKDELGNFRQNGKKMGVLPQVILGVYLNKHVEAIFKFIKNGRTESEPIETRITDAINYLVLLRAMVEEDKSAQEQTTAALEGSKAILFQEARWNAPLPSPKGSDAL